MGQIHHVSLYLIAILYGLSHAVGKGRDIAIALFILKDLSLIFSNMTLKHNINDLTVLCPYLPVCGSFRQCLSIDVQGFDIIRLIGFFKGTPLTTRLPPRLPT